MKPLVSVCLITYNHASHIAQAIDSVLSQKTHFEFEILIGDDESSDGTSEIVLDYHNRNPKKIRLFPHRREDVIYINGRATGRWNFFDTLSHAKGKYVAFLEGDDYWIDPLKLQKQVDVMEAHSEYAVCGHWVININESGKLLEEQTLTGVYCPEIFTMRHALDSTPLHPNSWLFRRFDLFRHPNYSLLLKLPAADDPLMLVLLGQGSGYCIKESMSAYRIHSGGTWSTKSKFRRAFEVLQLQIAAMKLISWSYTPRLLLIVSYGIIRLLLDILIESVRGRNFNTIRELTKLSRVQEIITPSSAVLWLAITIVCLPLHLILFMRRKMIKITKCCKGAS